MTASQILVFTLMFLAASAVTLSGVAVGAFITHRLMRGKPPLPEIKRRAVVVADQKRDEPPKIRLPEVRA